MAASATHTQGVAPASRNVSGRPIVHSQQPHPYHHRFSAPGSSRRTRQCTSAQSASSAHKRYIFARAGSKDAINGDDYYYGDFDDFEEYDEFGQRKGLGQSQARVTSASTQHSTRELARQELLESSGLLSSPVVRQAITNQQEVAKAQMARLQSEASLNRLADEIAAQGYDLDADWAALDALPKTTTGAAKARTAAGPIKPGSNNVSSSSSSGSAGSNGGIEGLSLIRPPSTPKIDAMRREVAEMRRRRRLFSDPEQDNYSSSSSDDELSTPSTNQASDLLAATVKSKASAFVLQNIDQMADYLGSDGLKSFTSSQPNSAQSRQGSRIAGNSKQQNTFGLAMFADEENNDTDDFGSQTSSVQGAAAIRQTQPLNVNSWQSRQKSDAWQYGEDEEDDVTNKKLTDGALKLISKVAMARQVKPALNQPPAIRKQSTNQTLNGSSTTLGNTSSSKNPSSTQPLNTRAWLNDDDDDLISLLEGISAPQPKPVQQAKPVFTSALTQPPSLGQSPNKSIKSSTQVDSVSSELMSVIGSTAKSSRAQAYTEDQLDDEVDGMLGGLLRGNAAAGLSKPQLASRPVRGLSSSEQLLSTSKGAAVVTDTSLIRDQQPNITYSQQDVSSVDDEDAEFERMYAAAKEAAMVVNIDSSATASPQSRPRPDHPTTASKPAATKQADSKSMPNSRVSTKTSTLPSSQVKHQKHSTQKQAAVKQQSTTSVSADTPTQGNRRSSTTQQLRRNSGDETAAAPTRKPMTNSPARFPVPPAADVVITPPLRTPNKGSNGAGVAGLRKAEVGKQSAPAPPPNPQIAMQPKSNPTHSSNAGVIKQANSPAPKLSAAPTRPRVMMAVIQERHEHNDESKGPQEFSEPASQDRREQYETSAQEAADEPRHTITRTFQSPTRKQQSDFNQTASKQRSDDVDDDELMPHSANFTDDKPEFTLGDLDAAVLALSPNSPDWPFTGTQLSRAVVRPDVEPDEELLVQYPNSIERMMSDGTLIWAIPARIALVSSPWVAEEQGKRHGSKLYAPMAFTNEVLSEFLASPMFQSLHIHLLERYLDPDTPKAEKWAIREAVHMLCYLPYTDTVFHNELGTKHSERWFEYTEQVRAAGANGQIGYAMIATSLQEHAHKGISYAAYVGLDGVPPGWVVLPVNFFSKDTIKALLQQLKGQPLHAESPTSQQEFIKVPVGLMPSHSLAHSPFGREHLVLTCFEVLVQTCDRYQRLLSQTWQEDGRRLPTKEEIWDHLKGSIGQWVTGKVVASEAWGVWLEFMVQMPIETTGDCQAGAEMPHTQNYPVLGYLSYKRVAKKMLPRQWRARASTKAMRDSAVIKVGDMMQAKILCLTSDVKPPQLETLPSMRESLMDDGYNYGLRTWVIAPWSDKGAALKSASRQLHEELKSLPELPVVALMSARYPPPEPHRISV